MRDDMQLGEGPSTDLLVIGLSATDYIGHSFGTGGSEMCIQMLALDRILGDFFAALDRDGVDYVVMLTADHGGHDLPERIAQQATPPPPASDPALNATAMGRALGRRLHLQGPVLLGDGPFGDMYDRPQPARARRAPASSPRRSRAYRAHPQVAAVFTRAEHRRGAQPSGPPETWTPDPARPRLVRPAALGRFLRRAEAAHHPDRRRQPRLGRHPWQRLGL